MIKFVSDLRQVGGFLCVLQFPPNKIDCHDVTEILLKMALNTIKQTNQLIWSKSPVWFTFLSGQSCYCFTFLSGPVTQVRLITFLSGLVTQVRLITFLFDPLTQVRLIPFLSDQSC